MLNQSEDTEVWDSVKTFISSNQGTVKSEHSWGTRRLAYPIQKGQQKYLEGTYHLSRFETESPFNKELENLLKLDERVLRSLIVSITDEEAEVPLDAVNPGSADAPLGRRPGYQGQRPQYGGNRDGNRDHQSNVSPEPSTTEQTTEQTTEAPAAEETAEAPAAEETTEAPAAEETAEAPAAEETTEAPAAEETTEKEE